jgi:hypothetical protein
MYKSRKSALDICAKSGTAVPGDVSRDLVFYHFQQDHASILRTAPLQVALVEQWMHGFARWAVRDREDQTLTAEFDYITGRATEILAALDVLERVLLSGGPAYLRAGTRTDATDLVARFSAFRTSHVRTLVHEGLRHDMLAPIHDDFRAILAAYEQLHAAVPRFIEGVKRQVDTEGTAYSRDGTEQDQFIARTLGGIFRAFIRGLLGSQLKPPDGFRSRTTAPTTPTTSSTALAATFNFSPQSTTVSPIAGHTAGFLPAPGGFATVQQNPAASYPSSGPYSLENQARQVAHGYRSYGPYMGPAPGGSSDGIDLTPEFRRLLFAHQIVAGHRLPGQLSSLPPDNLPPLTPLDVLHAPRTLAFNAGPGQAPYAPQGPYAPFVQPAPPPYHTGATMTPRDAGGAGARARPRTVQDVNPGLSDELYIPYSYGMLGAHSPYRTMRPPEACYECGMRGAHYGNECPQRFIRVRGEVPPGWRRSGRTADKDPAQWTGADLTDEARAAYRTFLANVPVTQHRNFPITIDEIVGAVPPLARKGLGGTRP